MKYISLSMHYEISLKQSNNMKRIIFMLILFTIAAGAIAQELPPPREIPKEYRAEYRQTKRIVLKETKQLEKKWDIVIDPIEAVPIMQYDATNLEQPTSAP